MIYVKKIFSCRLRGDYRPHERNKVKPNGTCNILILVYAINVLMWFSSLFLLKKPGKVQKYIKTCIMLHDSNTNITCPF